jgi:Transposase, Mutator family
VRAALRQAWELDDAEKAERLIRNLARRLEQVAPGVAASILEGLDEMLTVIRLGLPEQLRRSLACTNIIENMMGTIRRVCRNVKRWRDASMALRWTAAAMQEAAKGFRRLKARRQLPLLRAARAQDPQSGGTDRPAAPVQEQSFFDLGTEPLQGTLQWAVLVARARHRKGKNFLVRCSCRIFGLTRKTAGKLRLRVSEHVGIGGADHLPTGRPLPEQVALTHQDPGDAVLPAQHPGPLQHLQCLGNRAAGEQQAAIRRMRKLKDQGLALRAIADTMTAAGVQISHVGVKKALAATSGA